ncbi:ABC transporter substrate-binding protein [Cetobacterium sp.]|uniref:ABC transporter substrate-binding protein n=1 Tax=Cetobacterium sp. TaxID=2071632 RepID=UPI003F2FD44F
MNLKKLVAFGLGLTLSTTLLGKEKVVFWHSMSGGLQTSLNKIVSDYNSSQNSVEIEAIYQGSYEETIGKFKAISGTKDAPTLIQMNDISTSFMYNSGAITPMQNFIEQDKFDVNTLEDALLNYYRIDGKLYSMPFNSSTAIMIYNKDAFREAGLDPNTPPKSYAEFAEYSKKLVKKNSNGSVDRYGSAVLMYGWFIEQFLANDRVTYVDKNNGRTGETPTSVTYKKDLPKILEFLRGMYKDGSATSYGRDWDSIRTAFSSGKVAMYFDSSAGIKGVINNSNFEVGTGFVLNESGNFNGSVVGGASLWITNSSADSTQKAAWDFIKYATSKDIQSYWSINTGYYPVNKASYDTAEMKQNMEQYPQFGTAVAEIKETKPSYSTQGAIIGVFPELRDKMVEAMEANYEGKTSVSKIVDKHVADSDRIIQRYNRINK